jgi:tellurite resistance protein
MLRMTDAASLAPLFSDVKISADEAVAIAAALRDVAAVDGTHADEQEMIDGLVAEIGAELGDRPELPAITPAEAAKRLVDPTLRTLMLQSAVLLAMADGAISTAERQRIAEYASAFGMQAEYAALERVIEAWVRSGDASALFA